jgi:hypothetical protein
LQWVFGIFNDISKRLFIPRFLAGTLRMFRETLVVNTGLEIFSDIGAVMAGVLRGRAALVTTAEG